MEAAQPMVKTGGSVYIDMLAQTVCCRRATGTSKSSAPYMGRCLDSETRVCGDASCWVKIVLWGSACFTVLQLLRANMRNLGSLVFGSQTLKGGEVCNNTYVHVHRSIE